MLMLITSFILFSNASNNYLNTSNVNVNQSALNGAAFIVTHLNTSNVNVNLLCLVVVLIL